MSYTITGSSTPKQEGSLHLKNTTVSFGISKESEAILSSPADIYLSALAACILKNIERFSKMMKFEYDKATIEVSATHAIKPSRLENINYEVILLSKEDEINVSLLKRNIEKYGTISHMIAQSCSITGTIVHRKS